MGNLMEKASKDSIHSMLRERIVEHVFVGDALRRLWQLDVTDVEVLRCEFDVGGYDLAMSYGNVVRHIQFKTVKASTWAQVPFRLIFPPTRANVHAPTLMLLLATRRFRRPNGI